MLRFRRQRGWMRRLGLLAVPLVIAASFLGLLIGITGLCIGADDMAAHGPMNTLCLFFCGAVTPPTLLLAALWFVLTVLYEQVHRVPFSTIRSLFHPPEALAG